jgi:hypothetical protein
MNLLNELNAAANSEQDSYKKLLFRRAAAAIHNLTVVPARPHNLDEDSVELEERQILPVIIADPERDRL